MNNTTNKMSINDFRELSRDKQFKYADEYLGHAQLYKTAPFAFSYSTFLNICHELGFTYGAIDKKASTEKQTIWLDEDNGKAIQKRFSLYPETIALIDSVLDRGVNLSQKEKTVILNYVISSGFKTLADKLDDDLVEFSLHPVEKINKLSKDFH